MSVGNWTPDTQQTDINIDASWLARCVSLSSDEDLAKLPAPFTEQETQSYSALMRLPCETWTAAVEHLDNDALIALIRFFTVAEQRISGWEAGANSPAIWINKVLKQRGERLSTEQLRWIRANSDNRFIPNGGL